MVVKNSIDDPMQRLYCHLAIRILCRPGKYSTFFLLFSAHSFDGMQIMHYSGIAGQLDWYRHKL